MEEFNDVHIRGLLENAPLYSWREYKKPRVNRGDLWIKEIDAFCETCGQIKPFHNYVSHGAGAGMGVQALSTGTSYFEFSCVSCGKQHHEYHVEQVVNEKTIKVQKYGELPKKNLQRDKILQKFFSKDSDNYEKAAVCLSHGYGIAAFAYLRRIVENNILDLLDMVKEDIGDSEEFNSIKEALDALRKETPMSNKIIIANNALPEYLKPDGLNPLGKLYQILSEGVHSLSDKECLERANAINGCIKYLISELAARKKNRGKFRSSIGSL